MKLQTLILMMAMPMMLAAQGGDADVMLQRAMRAENVNGDLKGAIELYKKIVAGAAKNRAAAAKALLRLGECYEKQGNAEAERAYERLVREFGDQKEQAHEAEARLTARGRNGGANKAISARFIAKGGDRELSGRVTPDGRLYPFIDQDTGDIAVRDLQTGGVRRLTNEGNIGKLNGPRGFQPVPSRDGRQIAYEWHPASGPNQLRVINMDGTGMRTVPVKAGFNIWDWSPDGKSLAVDAWNSDGPYWWEVATIDVATGEVHRIGRTAGFGDFEAAGFSSDGRWVVYSREVRGKTEPDWDIYAMNLDTRKETVLVNGPGRDRRPVWVPESDRIVFRSDRNGRNAIWMVQFRDGEAIGTPALVKGDVGDFTPNGISRDGSFFYTLRHESRDLFQATVDPQTLRARQTPARILETYLGHNWAPSWAPAGDEFAYYSERDTSTASRLVIHHANGTESVGMEPIRADQVPWTEFPAQWCGSDRLLALGAMEKGQVLLYDPKTAARLQELPISSAFRANDNHMGLAFSRDCQSFYFVASASPRTVYKFDFLTGAKSTVLTDNGAFAGVPLLSPDGRWLAVHGKLEGGTEPGILVLSTAGGPLRMLDIEGLGRNYSWSPDSKRLLYVHKASGGENELYWASPEGGSPQATGIKMPGLAHPSLNADGTRLLFGSATTANEFWVLRSLPLGIAANSR